jgi:hypothetical protein
VRRLRASDLLALAIDRRFVLPAASVALFALPFTRFYAPAGGGLDVTGHPIGRDFINVWAGPRLAFGGNLATLFDLGAYAEAIGVLFGTPLPFHNWGYPPFSLLLLWPFAQLPYFWALALWTVLPFAVFAAVTLTQVEPGRRAYALVALALAPACLINAVGGQNGFLTAALFLGGISCLGRRPILAGVLFGLLTYKPHLGLALPFVLLALGAWRTILAAVATTLVLVAGSMAVFGLEPWHEYLASTSAYQLSLLERFEGFYTVMMASVFAGARTLGFSAGTAWAVQIAVTVPVLATAVWAVTRTRDPRRRAFLLASAAPLLTPYAFNYDLTALAAVLVWKLAGPSRLEDAPALYFLAWLAPIVPMALNLNVGPVVPIVLLAVFLKSVQEAVGDRHASAGFAAGSLQVQACSPSPARVAAARPG